MSTVTRLQSSQHALHNLYAQHAWECTDLQRVLLSSHPLDATYLADQPNIFRCLKSSHYNPEQAAQRLTHTLTWRAAQDFTLESLPEELFSIISVHLDVRDVCARPACVFRLKNLPTKGKHDGLPRYLVAMLEVMRRALANERRGAAQMALVVDLQGAGYSNLDIDLLKWLMEVLGKHFPGLFGTVYIHNYSWLHSSLWTLLSTVLPRSALDKVVFTSKHEPIESFFLSSPAPMLQLPRPCALGKTLRALDGGIGDDHESRSSASFVSALSQIVQSNAVAPVPQPDPPSSPSIGRLLFNLLKLPLKHVSLPSVSGRIAAILRRAWSLLCIVLICRSSYMDLVVAKLSQVVGWYSLQQVLESVIHSRSLL